ncbi:MAG: NEW3 domain-containing protein, partial [Pirellulales bacterium]
MFGPDRANPDATATYRIELTNRGGTAVHDLVVEATLPPGWGEVGGTPSPRLSDGKLVWNIAEIGPAQTTSLEVSLRVAGRGSMRFCATVRTDDGRTAESCAATTVVAPAIDVKLTGPAQANVGSNVRFEIVITNHGDATAENLVLTDTFDEGLKHLVATSPIERAIGSLPAGNSTTVPLNFQVTRAGRLCHHAVVTGPGKLKVSADACLEAAQPPPQPAAQVALEVTKKGPRQRHAGETADFEIIITNTGNVALTNVRISDSYQRPLEPTDATAGFTVTQEELSWIFPRLEPGAVEKIRVRCRCVTAARQACNRVIATSDQGPTIADEACVEILPPVAPPLTPPANQPTTPPATPTTPDDRPPEQPRLQAPTAEPSPTPPPSQPESPSAPTQLSLTIADLADPVRVGEKVTYQIRVRNDGSAKAGPLTVVITFPDNLTPARVGTVSPAPSYKVAGQTVRFGAVAEIVAGDTLTYRVPFVATQAGDAQVQAELTANGLDKPIVIEEKTEVLE